MLTRAIELACEAHAGQVDKAGEPYILHPLRVMLAMETEEERIVAVLHDVIEDGSEGDRDALVSIVNRRQFDGNIRDRLRQAGRIAALDGFGRFCYTQ